MSTPPPGAPILSVEGLKTAFETDRGHVVAVDGISFTVGRGEVVGLVGESGSGKSVTALSIIGLVDEPGRIVDGAVRFQDTPLQALPESELEKLRGRNIGMVFQDPITSLNPVIRIGDQVVEAFTAHGLATRSDGQRRAIALLGSMGINSPERAVNAYPHQFSGGMRQRVALAMGISNKPLLLIADEPTTALDVTIQAQILDLLRDINREFGTAILLITHDLGVVASICTRTLVMYAGEIVEDGPTEALLAEPKHPYTWALVNAVPRLDRGGDGGKRLPTIEGLPPDPSDWPSGCRFAARCPFRTERCTVHPELLPLDTTRSSRCIVAQADGALRHRTIAATPRSSDRFGAAQASKAAVGAPILELTNLRKHYPLDRASVFGPRRVLRAVDGIDFVVKGGETVGLVGESGSGKSSLGRLMWDPLESTCRHASLSIL